METNSDVDWFTQMEQETIVDIVKRVQLDDVSVQRDKLRLDRIMLVGPQDDDETRQITEYTVWENLVWKENETLQLYVPKSARRQVLEECHDSEFAGHPGSEETRRVARKQFWWKEMDEDVAEWVRSCVVCAAVKVGRPKEKAPLRSRTPQAPWKMVSLDVLGPFEGVDLNHRFLLVLTDLFSRWVEAKPTGRATTHDQVEFLHDVFIRYGYPVTIITDSARTYTSEPWREYLEAHHIEHVQSAIYHQQANPEERRIRELKKTLRALVYGDTAGWPKKLPQALFALRNRRNVATGATPTQILFGVELKRPGVWTAVDKQKEIQLNLHNLGVKKMFRADSLEEVSLRGRFPRRGVLDFEEDVKKEEVPGRFQLGGVL
ncbi:uncharacterized protein K02A2.6-like [Anoplophora glabripennis]|uniref:uncharacterized protein K02A2.6-like n=1 Tax=Anoplophora glabripennis TaxID=217634 RepID=UPI0008756953|nr:uncharacterized protein K02A2.6-like [Anoplophora glabripennis]